MAAMAGGNPLQGPPWPALTCCLGMAFHALRHGGSWHVDSDLLPRQAEKTWNGMDTGAFLKA